MCQTKCQCLHQGDLEFLLEQIEASDDKQRLSWMFPLHVWLTWEQGQKSHRRRAMICLTWHPPRISLCHSCIIVLWPKVRRRQALALRCPWRLALPATESCWGLSLCGKPPFDFNDVIYSIFQSQFRNTSSEQIWTRKYTSSSSPLPLHFPPPLLLPPPPPLSRTALKV